MKRPLLWVALPFVLGLFLAARDCWPPFPWSMLSFVVPLSILVFGRRWPFQAQAMIALLFLACGGLWWQAHQHAVPGDPLYHYAQQHGDAVFELEGVVRHAPLILSDTSYAPLLVDVVQIHTNGRDYVIEGGVLVRWSSPTGPVHPGQRVRWTAPLSSRLGTVNFGVGGYEDYLHRRAIFTEARIQGEALTLLAANRYSPFYWASRLRHWEADVLAAAIPAQALPFVRTVWLGDNHAIDMENKAPFIKSGMAHLLAVSGLHCGIIFMALTLVLGPMLRSSKQRSVIILVAVLVFALAAGARIPSLRAATMIALYLSADWFNREPDAPTALSLSALLFLLYEPVLLFDTGFLLSFGSIASIMLFADGIGERLIRLPYAIRQSLGATLGVQLVPIPVAAAAFHTLPLIAPLLNVIAIPLLFVVLILTLLTVLSAIVSPGVALLFGHGLAPVVWLIQSLAALGAAVPGGHRIITAPSTLGVLFYGLTLVLFYWTLHKNNSRKYRALATVLFLGVTLVLWRPAPVGVGVDFLDVGHGDASVVRCPDGTTLLIDGGVASAYADMGASVVVPYLCNQGITYLDYVVATHPDADHMGGLVSVVETLGVGEAILGPYPQEDDPDEIAFLAACTSRGVPVRRLAQGEGLTIEGATAQVLHPPADWSQAKKVNDASLVLRVAWPGFSVLFSGDIEAIGEYRLAQGDCAAQILKVPHHGSRTSSTETLLDAVAPQVAVVSAIERNRFIPMRPEVQERYDARDIAVWRTDHHGAIRLRATANSVTVESARQQCGWLVGEGPGGEETLRPSAGSLASPALFLVPMLRVGMLSTPISNWDGPYLDRLREIKEFMDGQEE